MGIDLSAEGIAVHYIFAGVVEDTLAIEVTAADIVVYLVISTIDGDIVLGLWTGSLEDVAVPVEVSEVAVFALVIGLDPWPVRILGLVVPAVIEHLHLLVGVVPCHIAFA